MNVDLHTLARGMVQKLDRRLQSPPSQPKTRVAVQHDGTVVADGHRILNFTGAGVAVADDPTMRRTNVYVGGSAVTSAPFQLLLSSTSARRLSLWNGSSNNSPPANWETVGFNDSGWSNAVVPSGGVATTISGATRIWSATTPASFTEITLVRHTFTIAPGTYQAASITIEIDNYADSVYLNGTLLGSVTNGIPATSQSKATLSITPSLLIMGTNVLAVAARNADAIAGGSAWVAYVMDSTLVSQVVSSTPTAVATLGSDVSMPTANTYYDGPTVSLGAGTWLIIAYADVGSTTQSMATMRITDGTTLYASGSGFSISSGDASICAAALVTPGATTSYKIQCAAQQANATLRSSTAANGSGNNATRIIAIGL